MIDLTKNKRYSERAIQALLENYAELKQTHTDADPSHMDPVYDFEKAIRSVTLSDLQRKVFEVKYVRYKGAISNGQAAELLGVSLSSVEKAVREIKDAFLSEMNRGIADV